MEIEAILAEIQVFLSAIAAAIACVMAIVSLLSVRDRLIAEREFVRVLRNHTDSLREMRNRIVHKGVVTPAELEELVASLEMASKELPGEQGRLIANTLRRHSLHDRARYVAAVMSKIGVELGAVPVAVS